MRGLEAAVSVFGEVRKGAFASEALRKIYTNIAPNDRKLAATLLYCTLRRESLWKTVLVKYCRRGARELPTLTQNALMVGIAGIVELKYFALPVLTNGLVQIIKSSGDLRNVGLVNAVLHTVADESAGFIDSLRTSAALRDQALYYGVPGWAAAQIAKDYSIQDAKRIVKAIGMKTYMSLRVARRVNIDDYLMEYNDKGRIGWASPFIKNAVRTAANPYPLDLPGYGEGKIIPQSESSMLVADVLSEYVHGGRILDMCCGRGVKTGQLADNIPECFIEAWDLSDGKIRAAEFEMMRQRAAERVKFKTGNSLMLTPDEAPDAVLLDAPCTGSGTWGRHPEAKWRSTPRLLEENANLQKNLLEKAVSYVKPGGYVMYSTCSVFRDENEKVIADVMARHPEMVEIPINKTVAGKPAKFMVRGKPYGTRIFPALPWVDGFYAALLHKRK